MRLLLLLAFIFSWISSQSQIVINEISQGTGFSEYVELLVTGTGNDCATECVDLRGYILDDNNGWYKSGTGAGIARGAIRFSQDSNWECVKPGSLILIYNDASKNSAITMADDPTDTDCDFVYVLPISNTTMFECNNQAPVVNGTSSYAGLPWTATPTWTVKGMSNNNDSYQIVSPSNLNTAIHAVSWGNNTNSTIIYMGANSVSGTVMYMANTHDNNPSANNNWLRGDVGTNETPGTPNNTANANWINILNDGCGISVSNDTTFCSPRNTTCTLGASPSNGTFTWSTGATTDSITVTPVTDSTFHVTVTVGSCTYQDSIQVAVGQFGFLRGN